MSGRVRDAFIQQGCDAMSCDLLPSLQPGPHYQGDIFDVIDDDWDIGIFFPPCTHLCCSGARWFKNKQKEQAEAIEFFMKLANCQIPKTCIENPVGIMSTRWRKPDQIIQPFEHGDPFQKSTCLWLKNLPQLNPANIVEGREQKCWKMGPSPDRAMLRSLTYPGIAKSMAEQWSNL